VIDTTDLYLRDLRALDAQPLSRAQEAVLFARVRAGDEQSRQEAIEGNLRFVVTIAKKFQGRGMELSELIAVGNEGLIEAVGRFEPARGFKFISFAVWWIRQRLHDALRGRTVRRPMNAVSDHGRIAPHALRHRLVHDWPSRVSAARFIARNLFRRKHLEYTQWAEVFQVGSDKWSAECLAGVDA